MRETLRNFLQQALPAWTIVDASDGAAALAACEAFAPGIVLMDIALPDADGIRLTSRVKALLPDARVVFVSYHCGTSFRERALAAGGNGFVAKDRLFADLVPAIVAAAGTDG